MYVYVLNNFQAPQTLWTSFSWTKSLCATGNILGKCNTASKDNRELHFKSTFLIHTSPSQEKWKTTRVQRCYAHTDWKINLRTQPLKKIPRLYVLSELPTPTKVSQFVVSLSQFPNCMFKHSRIQQTVMPYFLKIFWWQIQSQFVFHLFIILRHLPD